MYFRTLRGKKEDFEDAIPMKVQKFKISASHHGRVYLPEEFVVREKEGGEEPHSHEQPLNCEQLLRREQLHSHEQPFNREQPHSPASSFNVQDRDKLVAKIHGYQSEAEMLHEQSEALRQARQEKEAKELEEIQKAEQFIDKQHEAFRDMEEKMKAVAAAKLPHPGPRHLVLTIHHILEVRQVATQALITLVLLQHKQVQLCNILHLAPGATHLV